MRSQHSLLALLIAVCCSCRTIIAWMPANDITACRSRYQRRQLQHQSISKALPQSLDMRPRSKRQHLSLVVVSLQASTSTMEVSTMVQEKESSTQPTPEPPPENESELSLQEKIINALFLGATFGYAVYTILNIDHGITRGWTTSEIAMRIPLDNWGAYEDYLANKPVVTKTLINVIIYLLGDWLSQTVFQKKNVLDFDISRTMKNGFIGLCFGPLVHEYYQFSDTILPPENGLVTKLEKIFMDQTIYLTVKCSIYISAVGLLNGDGLQTVQQTVKEKIGGVVITAWKFWPIIHCITYGLIPARHRILWVNSVDLVWNAILSSKARDEPEEETTEGQPEQLMLLHSAAAEEEDVPGLLVESSSSSKASDDDSHHTHDIVTLDNHQWVADQQQHDVTTDILPTNTFSSSGNNTSTSEAVATP